MADHAHALQATEFDTDPTATLTEVLEIAETFNVGRTTLYRQLHAYGDGGACVLVVYRNTRTRKLDPDTNRRYGETGASEKVQRSQPAWAAQPTASSTPHSCDPH